jgi:CRISPR/Cas system-associated exonuclease Cas4 (RecB family)
MELFSFSRLSLYSSCPKRWHYKYIVKLDDPAGAPAILGKTVHKAIELVLNGRLFNEAVLAAITNEGDSTVEKSIVESMVKTALSYGYRGPTEQHFVMVLAKGIRLQGYIDVISNNGPILTLVDWKSGFKLYKVLDSWQLPLYAASVMEQRGIEAVKGVLAFLRFNATRTTLIARKEASQAKAWAIQIAEEIQERLDLLAIFEPNEIFPAKPSPACRNCPWCVRCLMEDKGGIKVC